LEYDGHCFINFPNSDAGSNKIIEAYQEYSKRYLSRFTLFQNLNRKTYVGLLNNAEFLIGNSSSGIIEVASLGLAAINVGERQRGRTHGDNVIFVDNNMDQIAKAIKKVEEDEDFRKKVSLKINPYGSGNSSEKIVEILKNIELGEKLIYKNITY